MADSHITFRSHINVLTTEGSMKECEFTATLVILQRYKGIDNFRRQVRSWSGRVNDPGQRQLHVQVGRSLDIPQSRPRTYLASLF